MKQCSTCQEQFADKFSFCPVDGTPLNGFAANTVPPPQPDPEETLASSKFSARSESAAANAAASTATPAATAPRSLWLATLYL